MIPESERTPEHERSDEAVSAPDDMLRTLREEEPPISADDTSPTQARSLHDRLRADEPPLAAEDTNPARASLLSDEWPPKAPASPRGTRRFLAAVTLLIAVLLMVAAAALWLSADEDDSPDEPVIAENINAPATPTSAPTVTPELRETQAPAAAQTEIPAATPLTFPTAAADEIAAALLTPAPVAVVSSAIQRQNEPFTIRPASARTQVIQYTVQEGDTLESIATRFELGDIYSIVWANKRNKFSPLRPGKTLNILPEDGVYYEVTDHISIADLSADYEVDPYTIIDAEYNNLFGSVPDTLLPKGMWVVIPGAEGERVNLLPPNTQTFTGADGGPGVVSGSYTLWGCTSNVGGGSPPYTRPLDNYTWMQGFSPGGHEGVDLAANVGESVHAAGGGTVAFAGWNNYGYGYVVVIAHGPTFTIYGHLDTYKVSCGQSVSAGNLVGTVGNTGNSTGPHLHFEVRDANWNARNPQDYIGF